MPIESSEGGVSAALRSLGSLPFVGVPGIGGESANKLVAVLESRTVAEDVIKTLDLITVLFEDDQDEQPTFQDAVRSLTDITEITDDKEGLISITVEYKAPRMAADIANQYTIYHRTPTIPQ
jgi:capsular polysaccharide biosynthesis protein